MLIGKHDEAYRKADKIAYVRSSTQQVAIPPVIVQEPAIALDLAKLRTKKYLPLARFPTEQPATVGFVTLGFSDVEEIIENTLPRSAFQYRAWRANDHKGHSCSVAWLGVRAKTMDMGMRERGKLHLTVSKESIGIGGRDETRRFP